MSSSSSDISVSAAAAPMAAPVLEQRVFLPHEQFEPHDAKGTFVKGADFQELYYYNCIITVPVCSKKQIQRGRRRFSLLLQNMRIHDSSGYGGFCARGVDLVGHVSDPTLWGAYICKVPHAGYQYVLSEIIVQLGIYAKHKADEKKVSLSSTNQCRWRTHTYQQSSRRRRRCSPGEEVEGRRSRLYDESR